MKLFLIRHQSAGVLYGTPFPEEPNEAQLSTVVSRLDRQYGREHPKTGQPYWIKVISVEGEETRTVKDARTGAPANAVDLEACGGCPIREAGLERWEESEALGGSDAGTKRVGVSGEGQVG